MCLFFASDLLQWNEWVSEQKEKGWHTQYIAAAAAVDLSDINPHILFNNDNSSNDKKKKKNASLYARISEAASSLDRIDVLLL